MTRKLQNDGEDCRGGGGKYCNIIWGERGAPKNHCTTFSPGMIKREVRDMEIFRVEKK